ncbi:MAG: energy transducer TonB [Candidatus Eisenbacteria sp.]|jgi:protein TonB|nr:energy transducer TonB [Candidatus Eisenbacteria bacterium]
MRRLFIISASIHVALFALLPVLPNLGVRQPLAMEVYAVELVDLPREAAPVEEVQEEKIPEPEPAPVEPPPEADPIPERPVQRPVRKVVAPPPKRVEKSLEEKIADRLKAQDERRPEQKPQEEAPKPQTTPSRSTKISAGKVVADYYLTMLQGKITRNWKQPSARFTGGDSPTARVSFTVLSSGSITNLRLTRSSDWSTIDQSAVQAVRASAPFAELPSTYLGDRLDVTIDFTITQ